MARRYNTHQALRHVVDRGFDSRFDDGQTASAHLSENHSLRAIIKGWYATGSEGPAGNDGDDNDDDGDDSDGKETRNVHANVRF